MAAETGPPPGSPGGRRRPPTIELEATEVSRDRSASQSSDSADPTPDAAATEPGDAPSAGLSGVPWRLIGAGAVGAAGVLVVLLLLSVAGLWPRAQDPMVALGPRLGAIEAQLRELAARPPPATIDPKTIDELRARLNAFDPKAFDELRARLNALDPKAFDELKARLAKLETAVAAPQPPATDAALLNRVTATDDAVKALTASIEQLARRTDALAAQLAEVQTAARASGADRKEIAALTNKIAALEQSNQAIRDELAKRASTAASDRSVRLAMLAVALRDAVVRGGPFAVELAAVKPLAANATTLAGLEPYATSGLPNPATLGRELAGLIEPMRRAAGAISSNNGFIGRLQANAEKLVRIRPVGETPGDAPTAILSRIEAKAIQGDIDAALAELAKLPPAAQAPAQAWLAKAQARQAAVGAANRVAAEALAALKTP